MMITPRPLFPGARVALVSPASPVPDPSRIEASLACLRALHLDPVLYPSCTASYGYLSGRDDLRAKDVMDAFLDDSVDGIFCIRGGYGVQRLLPLLDFEAIRSHPKWFAGYSDITALHIMLNQACGLVTYHTPMPSTEMYKGLDDYTDAYLRKALFGSLTGELPGSSPASCLVPGTAEGILTGGNLSLVSSSLGTPYEIDTKGKILFLEDVDEAPYRIDGMLNHLRLAGKFDDCAGILLGYFTDCAAKDPAKSLSLLEVFQDLILPCGKPTVYGYTCGHSLPSMSLPLGARARLSDSSLTIL